MTSKITENKIRIGVQIAPNDPFWVQVNETVRQKLGDRFVAFEIIERGWGFTNAEMDELSEEILSNEFGAFICMILPKRVIERLLQNGLPVICVEGEIEINHPLFSSVKGWQHAGQLIAQFLANELDGRGQILCLTGNIEETQKLDFNRERLEGIWGVIDQFPGIECTIQKSYWSYQDAYHQLVGLMETKSISKPDAILGLSDSMALAARVAGEETGFIGQATHVVGINGEPTVLSTILNGRIQATVNIPADEFAEKVAELARAAIENCELPDHFTFTPQLVTRENVAEVSIQKLALISNIPAQLVGINRATEKNRLLQYELTASINQQMAVLQDKSELVQSITELIRVNYAYDRVYLYSVDSDARQFRLENPTSHTDEIQVRPFKANSIVNEVFERREAIFVADVLFSRNKFAQEPRWQQMRSRAVLPVRFGEDVLGILDLQSDRPKSHLRNELIGLQLVTDQIGVALYNANLYEEAIQARAASEKANQLKTRLLANVSHELRAPLNVILGYCQAIISKPELYDMELPADLFRDLGYIFDSGEHLIRLINDLLDVSRAEIGALELYSETISPQKLLEDIFSAMAESNADVAGVEWRLDVPDSLPLIKADSVRMRQILINLLSNAQKFTEEGEIVLGAVVETPYLHIYVKDSGIGIPQSDQERIFEPFLSANSSQNQAEGIGLGLNITRQLVLLHEGKLTLDSAVGKGSTFHVYLPLPNISGQLMQLSMPESGRLVLLDISSSNTPDQTILQLCQQQNFEYFPLRFVNDLETVLADIQPIAIAWDLSDYDPHEWEKIEVVRKHPDLNRIPFLVYARLAEESGVQQGVTNILTKPIQDQSLYDYLQAVRPATATDPILIVDDDPQTRKMYKEMIGHHLPNFAVIEAKAGDEAIALLETQTPSLILLDLMMPQVDGFKVLEVVRTDKRTQHIPVVVISGKVLSF
ncbi:MAG: ATP-binding protein [Chloroflexota bacterium]